MAASDSRAVLVCCSLVACTAGGSAASESTANQRVDAPTPAAPQLRAGDFVVLVDTATLYPHAQAALGASIPESGDRVAEVLHVGSEGDAEAEGDRVHVRTLGPDAPSTCASTFAFADDLQLEFWVERADLRPVLAAPVRAAFPDETKLELAAGVPVLDVGDAGRVAVMGQALVLAIDAADVGLGYAPPEPRELPAADVPLVEGAKLHYGERYVTVGDASFARALARRPDDPEPDTDVMLDFDGACGQFTLRATPTSIGSSPSKSGLYAMRGPKDAIPRMARNFDPDMIARSAGILGVMQREDFAATPYGAAFADDSWGGVAVDCRVRWTIASGSELTWAGGQPAGRVLRAHELAMDAHLDGVRVCFEVEGLELCADAAKLGRKRSSLCPGPDAGDLGGHGEWSWSKAKFQVGKGLGRRQVLDAIAEQDEALRACDEGLASGERRVVVVFGVGPLGSVVSVELRASELESTAAEMCVVEAVRAWWFPSPKGTSSVEVVYPIVGPG